MTKKQLAVLQILDAKDYSKALQDIEILSDEEKKHGRIIIAKADAFYELNKDIDALREYIEYCKNYPSGRGLGFALFGAAMCLKNLDLQDEALLILQLVPPDHFGLQAEVEDSQALLKRQSDARDLLKSWGGLKSEFDKSTVL